MSRKKRKKIPFKALPKDVKIRKIITWVLSLVCIASLGYFGIYVKQMNNTQENYDRLESLKSTDFTQKKSKNKPMIIHLNGEEEAPEILPDYVTLYNNNKRLIGWIKIDDTLIDYPVMQSTNEDYYLNHNFNQEKDNNGSIFIDSDCSIWPRSQNIIIYGHNMKSGKMFGELKKYKSESFYEQQPYIYFDTLYSKGKYQVMYAFSDIVYNESDVVFKYYQFIDANSEDEWNSSMNYMAEKSMYDTGITAAYGDELITLSTCDYQKDAERFVVVAKKIK